jgi:AcrR family transcriptional regulator
MDDEKLGLRERKRLETRARLERAAVELVILHGIEHVTIDAISEKADVSSRTFFNYFDSKEDAILGIRDFALNDENVLAHAAENDGSDLIEVVVRLLTKVLGSAITDSAIRESRMELIRRHPELLERQIAQMTRMAEQLSNAVQTLVRHDPSLTKGVPTKGGRPDTMTWTEPLLSLCGGAVRTAVKQWVAEGSIAPVTELEERAISLVREVIERLK